MHHPIRRVRGSDGYILNAIEEHYNGQEYTDLSLVDLVVESGYSLPTVHAAVRRLESLRYFRRECRTGKPTRYWRVSEERRRTIAIGILAGLLVEEAEGVV